MRVCARGCYCVDRGDREIGKQEDKLALLVFLFPCLLITCGFVVMLGIGLAFCFSSGSV